MGQVTAEPVAPVNAECEATTRQRVLIFRSCRAAQFGDALRVVRKRHPAAEIVVLSHRGHRDALLEAGVDRVIEIPGRRFGLFRTSPSTLACLRSEYFDEIVIPQMSSRASHHVNLYWLAVALRCPRFVILPGDEPVLEFARPRFLSFARLNTLSSLVLPFDAPLFLALLVVACVVPRPRLRPAPDRRRRVLYVISSLGAGGAQVQLAELLNRTPPDRYDVELLVLGRSDGEFSRQWLQRSDIEITFLEQWPELTTSILEIVRRCRARRYDMVHTWLFMANIVGSAAARLAGVPLVISSVRNLSVWKRELWYRKWWHRPADILGSHAADIVTVNARALVADHAQWARMRASGIEVIHNGLDPSRLIADRSDSRRRLIEMIGARQDAALVGTVGRLAHEKDQVTFLRLLAHVRKRRPDVHGIIIGGGELRSHLETVAGKLGLTGSVTFLGERPDARMLMAGFDLFVLTSRSEGFPNVLLEATFLGVPCVATDIAGNPDVLEFQESLFAPGDIWAGTARVLSLLDAPAQAAERAKRARQRALSMFTADRMTAAWLGLYDRYLAGNCPNEA